MSALPYAGAICWRELSSPNPQHATRFYRDLFSWTSKDVDMGPMGTYTILNNGEEMVAGVMAGPSPEVPSHWINYVTVDDVDASAAKVVGWAKSYPASTGRPAAQATPRVSAGSPEPTRGRAAVLCGFR